MSDRLAGKAAIVTGAAGGIGAATAELFCEQGARVVIADISSTVTETAEQIRQRVPGARVVPLQCDVSVPADAQRVADRAIAEFGELNVLVSNAAIRHFGDVEGSSTDDWEQIYRTNVLGAVNFARATLGALRKSSQSSIVIVSSCYAVIGRKGMPIYDASKAALLSLVKTLAWEQAEYGIRVNGVLPGGTLTPHVLEKGRAMGQSADQMRNERKGNSLLGRRAEPREIAFPILWLASDEASYITGTALMVDAGLSIM